VLHAVFSCNADLPPPESPRAGIAIDTQLFFLNGGWPWGDGFVPGLCVFEGRGRGEIGAGFSQAFGVLVEGVEEASAVEDVGCGSAVLMRVGTWFSQIGEGIHMVFGGGC
jgi:hypothetical protein